MSESTSNQENTGGPLGRWLKRRRCMHHDRHTGQTWIKTALIDLGRAKLIWCGRCGKDF